MATRKDKVTHEQAAFYILYGLSKKDPEAYHAPSVVDVGDVHVAELNEWVFTTWKTPTRLTDIYQQNPLLLERTEARSRAGTKYYRYRVSVNAKPEFIKDPQLRTFYERIRSAQGRPVRSASDPRKTYTVRYTPDGQYHCTCDGYRYRKTCSHVDRQRAINSARLHDAGTGATM